VPDYPVKLKCFIAFLLAHGFKERQGKSGSHLHFTKKGIIRAVVLQQTKKEVPPTHIRTNAKTIGVTAKEIYDWIQSNC
jgi:predicted RNA binding protein YcfA (HicA-like mRNA interferase family)